SAGGPAGGSRAAPYTTDRILPIKVTPIAPPSSYDTSSIQSPLPPRSSGALSIIVLDAAVMAAPRPAPSTNKTNICTSVDALYSAMQPPIPRPDSSRLPASIFRLPTRGNQRPAKGPEINEASGRGRMNNPASNG